MDLNPLFTGSGLFRPAGSGGELKLLEQAGIKLVHGWLVDPSSPEYDVLSRTEDYDSSVNLLVEADHATKGNLVVSDDFGPPGLSGRPDTIYELSLDEQRKVEDGTSLAPFRGVCASPLEQLLSSGTSSKAHPRSSLIMACLRSRPNSSQAHSLPSSAIRISPCFIKRRVTTVRSIPSPRTRCSCMSPQWSGSASKTSTEARPRSSTRISYAPALPAETMRDTQPRPRSRRWSSRHGL